MSTISGALHHCLAELRFYVQAALLYAGPVPIWSTMKDRVATPRCARGRARASGRGVNTCSPSQSQSRCKSGISCFPGPQSAYMSGIAGLGVSCFANVLLACGEVEDDIDFFVHSELHGQVS